MDLKYGFNYYKDETISYRAQYYSSRDGVGTNDKKPNYDKFSTKCRENGLKSIYENINQWKSTFTPKKNNILSCINNIKERYCNNEHQST